MTFRREVPGKVFLLGEYGVLGGGHALVATVELKFQFEDVPGTAFHPDSPAGKWLSRAGEPLDRLRQSVVKRADGTSEILNSGGFGASTAQFLAAHALTTGSPDFSEPGEVQQCWRDYRFIVEKKASGADLVAQAVGESVLVRIQGAGTSDEQLEWRNVDAVGLPILIFSVAHQEGRKIVTHEHLEGFNQKDPSWVQCLDAIVMSGVQAIKSNDFTAIGKCFTDFSRELREKNLELKATTDDLTALSRVKGVLGAKGCDALQADAIAVVYDSSDARNRDRIFDFAKMRDWKFVRDFG